MKYTISQLSIFLKQSGVKRNVGHFLKFLALLIIMITAYSILFHYIMAYEGKDFSYLTGFYWTLTVMSTLGFGDITFTSDLGRAFSILVLVSGVIFLLVMLPFAFIQYVYTPWLEAQKKTSAPRKIPSSTSDHIIIVGISPITLNLIELLTKYGFNCILLCPDISTSLDLEDQNFNVIVGDYDDGTTYKNLGFDRSTLLLALDTDIKNTNIVFSARVENDKVPIIARAENEDSADILALAGATKVFRYRKLLGESLASKVEGHRGHFSYLTTFFNLIIAERNIDNTSLVGKSLRETSLRAKVGVNIVGLWEKGRFILPSPDEVLPQGTTLVITGTQEQLDSFDEALSTQVAVPSLQLVLVLGGGNVGISAAVELKNNNINVVVVDKIPIKNIPEGIKFIQGDASDFDILLEAGISKATSVIITTHDDDTNIYLTIYCRRLRQDIQILSRATLERNINILHKAGANIVLSLVSMMANSVVNMLAPGKIFMLHDGLSLFRARVNKELEGKSLIASNIRSKTGCSVVGIKMKKGNIQVNPDPYHIFTKNEEIYLIGDDDAHDSYIDYYGAQNF